MMTITPKFMGGELIGTITTNIGNPSPRHGFRIVEIVNVGAENLWEQLPRI